MDTINDTENSPCFYCKICDYKCCKKSDMKKHLLTKKHSDGEKGYKKDTKDTTPKNHFCDCGKQYLHHSGLWRHKKKCSGIATNSPNGEKHNYESQITPELIISVLQLLLLEQNKTIIELSKNGTCNNNTTLQKKLLLIKITICKTLYIFSLSIQSMRENIKYIGDT